MVTRTREQASPLVELLAEAGARCLEIPTLEIAPPDDLAPLDAALESLASYDWVIFTSANGVVAFMQRLFERGLDVRALGRAQIAAIGPATAQALRDYGLMADCVPETFRPKTWPRPCLPQLAPGQRVLLARAQAAREVLPEVLAPACRWRWSRSTRPGGPGASPRRPGPGSSRPGGPPHLHQLRHGA